MFVNSRLCFLLVAPLLSAPLIPGRFPAHSGDDSVQLAVVTAKSRSSEGSAQQQDKSSTASPAPENMVDQLYYSNVHPYLEQPLAKLIDRIPELKTLQPASDQQELPMILQRMGQSVDDFARDIGDLIADEDLTQEKLNARGKLHTKEYSKDNYLILYHGRQWGADAEYRMDENGNRLGPIGLEKGYVVTSGFALVAISFSSAALKQSRFRYLGTEKIQSRETYVVAFAQQPGEATFFTTRRGHGGEGVDMLTQGILWVAKKHFQIIRIRSDLLAPRDQVDQLTTEVTFSEVQLQDIPQPVWLPSDVDVFIEIEKQKFRNVHKYTNYRRYRVSVKIVAPQ
jgi:hypothetical protein